MGILQPHLVVDLDMESVSRQTSLSMATAAVKMREMIRCLVCGRMAWPTMLSRGEMGAHRLEILRLVKGLGRGILWQRRDVSRDPLWLRSMAAILKKVLAILEQRLRDLGEVVEEDTREPEKVSVLCHPFVLVRPGEMKSREMIHPRIVERVAIGGGR